jgi:hypothetical protein
VPLKHLVRICDEVGDKYGIPVVNKRISVSPIAVAGAPFKARQMLAVAATLNARPPVPMWISSAGSPPWWKKESPGVTGL